MVAFDKLKLQNIHIKGNTLTNELLLNIEDGESVEIVDF